MPDTGAPWNIPYVAGTDLVRDWPADSLALANAIDAGLDAAGNAGIGSNVVHSELASQFATSSGSFVDATDYNVTITPTTATSKVLLVISHEGLRIDNSNAEIETEVTATSGATNINTGGNYFGSAGTNFVVGTFHILHSPGTTSAVTYQMRIRVAFGSGPVSVLAGSRLTAIEVAA